MLRRSISGLNRLQCDANVKQSRSGDASDYSEADHRPAFPCLEKSKPKLAMDAPEKSIPQGPTR